MQVFTQRAIASSLRREDATPLLQDWNQRLTTPHCPFGFAVAYGGASAEGGEPLRWTGSPAVAQVAFSLRRQLASETRFLQRRLTIPYSPSD